MPFAPISKKDLPQTITLFNLHRNMETSVVEYYVTYLENVRVDEIRTSLNENLKGATRIHKPVILLDRRTTQGYVLDGSRKIKKSFLPWPAWQSLAPEHKKEYWTLYQQTAIAIPDDGQKLTIIADFDSTLENWQEFVERFSLRFISDIEPTIDDDGSIHSWTISLM